GVDPVGGEGGPVARSQLHVGHNGPGAHAAPDDDAALAHTREVGLGPVHGAGLHGGLVDLDEAPAPGGDQEPAGEGATGGAGEDAFVGPLDMDVGLVVRNQFA